MIIVYTGNGKGKTTAALGLVLRAVGWKKKVLIIQFMKKQITGELKAIKQLNNVTIEQYGTRDFVEPKKLKPVDYEEAQRGLESGKQNIENGKWDLIILDEINVAVKFGLIKVQAVLELIKTARKKGIDLVLTGRWAAPEIIKEADLVTEFIEVKHPYQKGQRSIKGIDY